MKRIMVILCLLLTIIAVMPLTIHAEETMKKEELISKITENSAGMNEYSSKYVSKEILNILDTEGSNNVVKIYNIPIVYAFSEYGGIDEIMKSKHVLQTLYAIVSNKNVLSVQSITDDMKSVKMNDEQYICDAETLSAFLNQKGLDKISSDITVKNVYYLWGESNHQGTALYYETNKGDYVYYKYYLTGGKEYLFPAADLFELMKAVYGKMDADTPPGGINIGGVWDLSPYDINANTFNRNAKIPIGNDNAVTASDNTNKYLLWGGISLCIVLLAVGLVFGGIYLRKKKA